MSGKSISPSAISGAIRMAQEQGTASERAAVVKWLREESKVCDCFARSQGECVCGAWDDDKTARINPIIDAIERGAHLQPQKED